LIDALYERKVKLVCSAQTPANAIFRPENSADKGDRDHGDLLGTVTYTTKYRDEEFAFDRCASRLSEMQSREYLVEARKVHPKAESGPEFLARAFGAGAVLEEDAATAVFVEYDVDVSGKWEREELELFLEDLNELAGGKREVTGELVTRIAGLVARDTGTNASVRIYRDDFVRFAQGKPLAAAAFVDAA